MKYLKLKRYLVFNEGLNTLAVITQEGEESKTAVMEILDDSFKEKKFIVRNLKSMIKEHHWLYLGEL